MTAPAATAPAAAATATGSRTVGLLALAEAARLVQAAIRVRLLADAVRLWPLLDPARLDATWPGWINAMTLLTTKYHGESAAGASAYYRAARQYALRQPEPPGLIKLAPPPDEQWVRRAFGYSGPRLLLTTDPKSSVPLDTTLGTAGRIAVDGSRTTILDTVAADRLAVGWYRVTDGNPCSFCALLASRGSAYKTEKSAGFKAHNHCGCTAAPSFDADQELSPVAQKAQDVYYQATDGVKNADRINAFRRTWEKYQRENAPAAPAAAA